MHIDKNFVYRLNTLMYQYLSYDVMSRIVITSSIKNDNPNDNPPADDFCKLLRYVV